MSLLAIIVIIVLLAAFIYMWAKCQSLQKEVHLKENKENELKKLALVLQNINAYFLLIDKDFVVCDTNYYSLNHLPVQVGGVTKEWGICCIVEMRLQPVNVVSMNNANYVVSVRLSVRLFARKQVLKIWKLP